jgi:hypothetical protein
MRRLIVIWAVAFGVGLVLVYGLTTEWHFGAYCSSDDFCWGDPGVGAVSLVSMAIATGVALVMVGVSWTLRRRPAPR